MKFRRIFENDFLHSTVFEKDCDDQFNYIFNLWHDLEYLFDFFNKHIKDLQSGFYGQITCDEAIEQTREDADALSLKIKAISLLGREKQRQAINKLFKPLDERLAHDLRSKAYGLVDKSWLRLYAIKYDGLIIITGGTIKLTKTMQERAHTLAELDKLRRVKDFLVENGVCDKDGFTNLVAEL